MLASGCARSATRSTSQPIASPEAAGAAPVAWCHTVPVEKSFCRALVIEAPRAMLRLAVAETDRRRERGLMGFSAPPERRDAVSSSLSSDRHLEFWMKDTLLPLDMVFVLADGTISKIAAGVPATKPGTPDAAIARAVRAPPAWSRAAASRFRRSRRSERALQGAVVEHRPMKNGHGDRDARTLTIAARRGQR